MEELLERGIKLLMADGINSKHTVQKEMEEYLEKIKNIRGE